MIGEIVRQLVVGSDASTETETSLAEYNFDFPKRIPKQKVLRLFDCEFIDTFGCVLSDRPHGNRKNPSPDGTWLRRL